MTERAQLFAQLAVVVDLAIESECVAAVVREHRLVGGGTCGDDREPSMAQTRAALRRIDLLGNPRPRIITPSMLNTREHRRDYRFRLSTNNACNPTHVNSNRSYRAYSTYKISNGERSRRESSTRNVARLVAASSS